MAIPKLTREDIINALEYIDKNGTPSKNMSSKYMLVTDDGKTYSPKYVIAVADHLANKTPISTENFNAVEAKNYLENQGFTINTTPMTTYELTITEDAVTSTDKRFTMDNLVLGDNYKPVKVSFIDANGHETVRLYNKGEGRISNQTLPRLACQIFEKKLDSLSKTDKEQFPICKYSPESSLLKGIFSNVADFNKYRRTREYLTYDYGNGKQFVIYCWNIFSTIIFVQNCLKRFGKQGDKFVLTYREKTKEEVKSTMSESTVVTVVEQNAYKNPYSQMLITSKNLIFRGAPGTGKSYLAKEIAADIISNGRVDDYERLTDEEKQQLEFVQFHPSYDYSDFVEGLRPKVNDDGTMGFELQDGVFKKFINRARKNYENSNKPADIIKKEISAQESISEFFSDIVFGVDTFKTINGREFTIIDVKDKHVVISIPENATVNKLNLNLDDIKKMLESGRTFSKIKDISSFFGKAFAMQAYSYYYVIYNEIKKKENKISDIKAQPEELKKYVFIIDEINRGEISKIFGELFFTIDPGYRGKAGEISTQYSGMHSDQNEKFYIPDNVYIIGTMNDIDRSVDSFDFAMRRRFRFVEIKAKDRIKMLDSIYDEDLKAEAVRRMTELNKEIAVTEDLNENYQIGAAYFLKLKALDFDQLWTDYLQPLLQEYVRGMSDEKGIMRRFAKAYGYTNSAEDDVDETAQD